MIHRAHRPAPRGRRPQCRTILRLESLEDRTLLSAAPLSLSNLAPGSYDPAQILVQFRPAALAAGAPTLNMPGTALGQRLDAATGMYDVQLTGLSVPAALALFQADPRVLSVEPDYYLQVTGTPNDPQFGNQWGLSNAGQGGGVAGVDVHAPQAWNVTNASPGVVTALIDTGVDYNHPDLYQNIWINQAEIPDQWYTKSSAGSATFDKLVLKSQIKTAAPGIITFDDLNSAVNAGLVWDVNGDGRIDAGDLLHPVSQGGWESGSTRDGDTAHPDDFFGWNFVANNNNPFDDNGHGTNVAGILGARGNNGVGVAGVDWQVPLQELKAFDSRGFSSISQIVSAIDYSIQHGAKISNNSWSVGSDSVSNDLLAAIGRARAAGQIFVAAAGNGGSAAPDYPAEYRPQVDNIVSVAAVDRTGKLWTNSNYGLTTVTLAGPGVDIQSTAPGGRYSWYTGTSQAVPFVSGTLALVWGQHPGWTYKQVIDRVTSTTTPLASLQGKTVTGGLVNAAAALADSSSNGGGHTTGSPTPHVLSTVFAGPDAHSLNRIVVTFDQIIDWTTFNPAHVRVTNAAGVSIPLSAVKVAAGSDGHQYEIDFGTQTASGSYTLTIAAGVVSKAGAALGPYSASYSLSSTTYTFASTQATAIPKQGTITSDVTVNQDVAIGSLQVALNITIPKDADLYIYLAAPNGTKVLLVNQRGGSGSNFQNTILSDSASNSIGAGKAPFSGSYQAENPLSDLKGINVRGVWRLVVENFSGVDVGTLTSWSLIVAPGSSGPGAAGEKAFVSGEMKPATPVANGIGHDRAAAVDAVFTAWAALHARAAAWPAFLGGPAAIKDEGDLLSP